MSVYALLWSKTWPIIVLVLAFVGCIHFIKFLVNRWNSV